MTDHIGKNTPRSKKVMEFVEGVERINAAIKELQESRAAIYATAKSEGYSPRGIRTVVKARSMKPQELQEAEIERDTYMHAAGMASEPPLYRQIEALAKESAAGEKLLETFKLLVPPKGDMIITIAGKRVRLWRDKDGNPMSEDYTPPEVGGGSAPHSRTTLPPSAKKDVPDCDADQAEALGLEAAKANRPVIDNPFPYDDARRPRWDLGWRRGTGNDGMEPDDE